MFRKTLLGFACALLVASVAWGQAKVVTLTSGGTLTGTVKQVDGGYEVQTKVGPMVVAAGEVVSIVPYVAPVDEYLERLKKIDRNDPDQRVALAEWAISKGQLKIAVQELRTAIKLRPDFEKATLMLRQVRARLAGRRAARTASATSKPAERKGMITAVQMNRIRLAELKAGEAVRLTFRNNVVERFIVMMGSTDDFRDNPKFASRFRRLGSSRKAAYMLEKLREVAPDNWSIRDDMIVRGDPASLGAFRRQVWPIVARTCASGGCHGAPKGKGQLKLFNVTAVDDIAMYTNFLILDMYTKRGRGLLYRDHVAYSLLLEYGLPRDDARWRHPREVTPAFRNTADPKYLTVKKWIESLNGPPHPNYGVSYQPPFGPKKTKPFDPLGLPAKRGAKQPEQPTTGPARP